MSKKKKVGQITATVLLFAATFVLLYFSLAPKKYVLEVGQAAPEDIYAKNMITDLVQTERLRDEAEEAVEPIYNTIPGVGIRVNESIGLIMDTLSRVAEEDNVNFVAVKEEIYQAVEVELDTASIERIVGLSEYDRESMREKMEAILAEVYEGNVYPEEEALEERKEYTYRYIDNTWMSQVCKTEAKNILGKVIQPNQELDGVATQALIDEARNNVKTVTYYKGDRIITAGEIITEEDYELLRSNGLLKGNRLQELLLYISIIVFIVLLLGMLAIYLILYEKDVINSSAKLFVLLCQIIVYLALANLLSTVSIYLIPITMLAMTLALLLKPRIALIVNLFAVMLVAISIRAEASFVVVMIASGILPVLLIGRVKSQSSIYKFSLIIGIVSAALVLLCDVMLYDVAFNTLLKCVYVVAASLVSGFGSVGFVYLWEWLFRIPSSVRIMEVSNLNHPLLKKMMQLAPGTYQHAVNVGNMAEAAAEEIGAESLVAKAGGLFHDVGKMEHASYFSENQAADKNPHDSLSAQKSVEVLQGHVDNGLALAKKHKLPRHIQNMIATHHGTSVMEYFYFQEKEKNPSVKKDDFRYRGPKPTGKEAAIVMLADGCEAAVKSLDKPNEESISEMVEKIFSTKEWDDQLSESDLTFAELSRIKKVFIRTLCAMYHERIQYPHQDDMIEELQEDLLDEKAKKIAQQEEEIDVEQLEIMEEEHEDTRTD